MGPNPGDPYYGYPGSSAPGEPQAPPVLTYPLLEMKNHIFISLGLYRLSSEALWIFQDATEEQLEALENLLAHVSISPDGKSYQERIDFAMDIIDAGMDGTLITVSPFVKYPPGSNYASQYPELTNYLKNEFPQLINDDLIVNALIQYGSLSEQQIKDL